MNHAKMERVKNAANLIFVKSIILLNVLMHISIPCINTMLAVKKFTNSMSKKDLKISIYLEREIKDTQNYDKIFHLLPREYYNIIKRYCKAGIISRHSCGQQSLYTLFTR